MATKKQLSTKLLAVEHEFATSMTTIAGLPSTIESQADFKIATDLAALLSMQIKNATTACKFFTDPLSAEVKEIKASFNTLIEPAEILMAQIKTRMNAFYAIEQARLNEEQKKIEQNALANAGKDVENVSVPVVNDIKTQQGNFGSSTARKIKKWRVTDEAKVPRKYLMIDDAGVTAAMRQGIAVDGVEYYEEISMAIRTK